MNVNKLKSQISVKLQQSIHTTVMQLNTVYNSAYIKTTKYIKLKRTVGFEELAIPEDCSDAHELTNSEIDRIVVNNQQPVSQNGALKFITVDDIVD